MELYIYYNIENDECIDAILKKNNALLMRKIIEFAETYAVTKDCIREYVVTLLANDDNVLSRIAQMGGNIGDDLYKIALFDKRFKSYEIFQKYDSYLSLIKNNKDGSYTDEVLKIYND